jgi:hypothetical protein
MEIQPFKVAPSTSTVGLTQVFVQLPLNPPGGSAVPLFVTVILSDGTAVESNEVTLAIDPSSVTSGAGGNTASFVTMDPVTHGNWKGVYGASGYNVIDDKVSYPAYVTVTPTGQSNYIWAGSTSDVRGLQKALSATDRIAASWYSYGSFTIDVNFNDGQQHQLALYCVDWDSGGGRVQTVNILDGASNALLNSQSLSSFQNGKYLVWKLTGHVIIQLTNNGMMNATVSGLFFN